MGLVATSLLPLAFLFLYDFFLFFCFDVNFVKRDVCDFKFL
jgi:hypothetical protein